MSDTACQKSYKGAIIRFKKGKIKHSATFSNESVRSSCSPNFEMSISRPVNIQSIQTLLSGKQPFDSLFHLKRELSAYSLCGKMGRLGRWQLYFILTVREKISVCQIERIKAKDP